MKIVTTTNARRNLARLVDQVVHSQVALSLGRRNRPEVLLIPYPAELNSAFSAVSNFNTHSSSFDFLKTEPELYQRSDLKKHYV